MIGTLLVDLVTKPGNAPLFDNPENYGLVYENVDFPAEDGVFIRGWLVNPDQKNRPLIKLPRFTRTFRSRKRCFG